MEREKGNNIILEILSVKDDFNMVKYSWTSRIANSAAYQLARFDLDNSILDYYSGPIPDFV